MIPPLRLLARGVQRRHDAFGSAYWSIRSTLAEHTPVLVTFDGVDWRHRWWGGCLYLSQPVATPRTASSVNLGLFLRRSQPTSGGVAVDVGAGSGTEIHALSDLVGPDGLVVAVEADRDACRHIAKLSANLKLRNVIVHQVAVGETAGESLLVADSPASQVAHLACPAESMDGNQGRRVAVVTLDSLMKVIPVSRPLWIKMNIEGAEAHALRGAEKTLSRQADLVISCHDFLGEAFATHDEVVEILERAGYSCEDSIPEPGKPWTEGYVYAHPSAR